jgi:hypothetical protein
MNNTTILQIPINKSLRDEVETLVRDTGFSSLQEYLRVHLTQLKNSIIKITTEQKPIQLSPKAIARYNKISKDIISGKNITSANSVDELMQQLNA